MSNETQLSNEHNKQPMNQDNGTASTLMNETNLNTSTQTQPNPQEYHSKDTYHQSCETFLYWDMVKIMVDKDYTRLTISGAPTTSDLKLAFEVILQEYVALIHTEKSDSIVSCYLKMVSCETKMTFLENALTYLKACEWDEEIAERIALFGYDYIQPLEDRNEYLKQIYIAQNEIKVLVIMYNEYKAEYMSLVKVDGDTQERSLIDYEEELAILGRFQSDRIDKKVTTVMEFVAILNNYIKYNNALRATI
jgi:hypothetical protein